MILGITGNIASGKDTVANMIQYYYFIKDHPNPDGWTYENFCEELNQYPVIGCWQIKKFAAKLKQIAAILVGCNEEDFESQEFKDKFLTDEWDETDYDAKRTYCWLLQQLGTEAIRNNIHKETWVNALFADFKNDSNWIISDLRFLNEAKAIKDRNGIIIRILRPLGSDLSMSSNHNFHTSETELNQIIPNYKILNNGTIEDLYVSVKAVMDDICLSKI